MSSYQIGAIIGALLVGIGIGAVPAICGAVKHKLPLAIGGFLACVVSALILGALLAVPVCAVFVFLIFRNSKVETDNDYQPNYNFMNNNQPDYNFPNNNQPDYNFPNSNQPNYNFPNSSQPDFNSQQYNNNQQNF